MQTELTLLDSNPKAFFKILPLDWQPSIVPYWNTYRSTAKIYVFKDNHIIIAGGILFSTCPPDMIAHREEAQKWFDNGYLYIGFLFVAEPFRNQKLGSQWVKGLKELMPEQNFWLVIEEASLGNFYERHGFTLEKTIVSNSHSEWLYTYVAATEY